MTTTLYEGSINIDLGGKKISVKLKGILAVWADTGVVATMGVTLSGNVSCECKVGPTTFPFSFNFEASGANRSSKFNEIVKLIENISQQYRQLSTVNQEML